MQQMSNNYLCEQRVSTIKTAVWCSSCSHHPTSSRERGYFTMNLPDLQHTVRGLLYNHLFFLETSQCLQFPIYRSVSFSNCWILYVPRPPHIDFYLASFTGKLFAFFCSGRDHNVANSYSLHNTQSRAWQKVLLGIIFHSSVYILTSV